MEWTPIHQRNTSPQTCLMSHELGGRGVPKERGGSKQLSHHRSHLSTTSSVAGVPLKSPQPWLGGTEPLERTLTQGPRDGLGAQMPPNSDLIQQEGTVLPHSATEGATLGGLQSRRCVLIRDAPHAPNSGGGEHRPEGAA